MSTRCEALKDELYESTASMTGRSARWRQLAESLEKELLAEKRVVKRLRLLLKFKKVDDAYIDVEENDARQEEGFG